MKKRNWLVLVFLLQFSTYSLAASTFETFFSDVMGDATRVKIPTKEISTVRTNTEQVAVASKTLNELGIQPTGAFYFEVDSQYCGFAGIAWGDTLEQMVDNKIILHSANTSGMLVDFDNNQVTIHNSHGYDGTYPISQYGDAKDIRFIAGDWRANACDLKWRFDAEEWVLDTSALPGDVGPITAPAKSANTIISTEVLPDMNGNGYPELAVLMIAGSTSKPVVVIKDSHSKTLIKRIPFFNANWTPKDFTYLDDINGNGYFEISVLAIHNENGNVRNQIKDSETKTKIHNIVFPK